MTQIERDLSLFLELLATLSEAGLAFDAGLDRILNAQPSNRPLTEEFRVFQREVLSGVPRVLAPRRVSARADVLSLTILISALSYRPSKWVALRMCFAVRPTTFEAAAANEPSHLPMPCR